MPQQRWGSHLYGIQALPTSPRAGALTYEWVCHMRPVNAALQFQLIVRLNVEKKVLVKPYASHQVSPVRTLQGATAVNVLKGRKMRTR